MHIEKVDRKMTHRRSLLQTYLNDTKQTKIPTLALKSKKTFQHAKVNNNCVVDCSQALIQNKHSLLNDL